MPWAPRYATSFGELLIKNLLEYIRTNDADALTWANGGAGLVPFAAIYNSTIGLEQESFPHLGVVSSRVQLSEDVDESGVDELHQIALMVEVEDANATTATINFFRYMRAVDSMCRTIPQSTLMAGITGTQHGRVEVTNHDYGILKVKATSGASGLPRYLRSGLITVEILINERRI